MIQLETISDLKRFEELRGDWDALLKRDPRHTFFQIHEWNEIWWRTFGRDNPAFHLSIRVARKNGKLVGIAPLLVMNRRLSRTLSWIGAVRGNAASDYCDLIVDDSCPDARKALVDAIIEEIASPGTTHSSIEDAIELANIPSDSPTLKLMPGHFWTEFSSEAPACVLGDAARDQELLKKKSLKRHFNHFQKRGRLEFKQDWTAREIHAALPGFFEQHAGRRSLKGSKSQFADAGQKRFYESLVEPLLARKELSFSAVLLDDKPIAFHYGFEYAGKLIWYKPSFDPALAKHSPGEVLLKFLFEDAIARKLREVDFTVGNEAFKYRFANEIRSISRVRFYRKPWLRLYHRTRRFLSRLRISLARGRSRTQSRSRPIP